MKNTTIFFDVGGTLLDAPDLFEHITRQLSKAWPDPQTYDLIRQTFFSLFPADELPYSFISIEEMLTIALSSLAKKYSCPDLSRQAHQIYLDVYLHQSSLFSEVREVLDRLFADGVKMVISSDADSEIMELELAKHDLNKYFVDKCISESVGAYKPTTGFTCHLTRHITGKQEDCFIVGDSRVDVESGKRLGIKSVLVDRKNSRVSFGADYVIRDLRELVKIIGVE